MLHEIGEGRRLRWLVSWPPLKILDVAAFPLLVVDAKKDSSDSDFGTPRSAWIFEMSGF